ncbi:Oidioi.mRNA.OKI2018_I69.XSR.g16948.t1.cds [Oikopleura dioica]|uniref:Oidioi.mRNA.OKI2018_I69.XSR.g16948.t1.cds n=1 Tax=Oikopleura dioica TaxID=34765 RepID=A0ABN7SMV5_OIKDI|nr:Oidioi.mRNA.OKI2018_I69.XSR.g16948.t1.cds [Oikopleura dioica]
MKLFDILLSATATVGVQAMDQPAGGETSVIMINMNTANIQMNMGDFSGSSVPGQEGESTQVSWIEGLSNADRDTLTELLANEEVNAGMKLLVEKLPGFSSFYDALYPEETATEATGTGGMGK